MRIEPRRRQAGVRTTSDFSFSIARRFMETCKVELTGDYCADYGALARAVGSSRLRPASKELAFVLNVATDHFATPGSIRDTDAAFLSAVIGASGARRGMEIGTASGVSAAVIVAGLARSHEERGEALPGVLLDTIDRKARCLFDATRPTGYMVREIVPDLVPRVRFHTGEDARIAKNLAGPRELDFAFIDGNHQHPWPLMDALCLLPLMRPGAWIVMHDIDNPPDRPAADVRLGARHVFQGWPWAKIDGGYIGAVQVPEDRRGAARMVSDLLRLPFEVTELAHAKYRKRIKKLLRASQPSLGTKILTLCGLRLPRGSWT